MQICARLLVGERISRADIWLRIAQVCVLRHSLLMGIFLWCYVLECDNKLISKLRCQFNAQMMLRTIVLLTSHVHSACY